MEISINHVKTKGDKIYQEYQQRRLVEMSNDVIISYLFCIDALKSDRKKIVAQLFMSKALPRCKSTMEYILADQGNPVELNDIVIGE